MENNKKVERLSADICIIGGAGSGLAAAVRAKECGAGKVIVLEKMKKVGGCTVFAGGMFAVDSPVQKRFGLFYNVDERFLDVMNIAHWDCNTKLVRKWYNKSGDIIRWLESKGLFYINVINMSSLTGFRGYHIVRGGTGKMIIKTLLNECREKGIEVRTETRARQFLVNKNNTVVGVLAANGDRELKITAKCVVLATGSISNNPELMGRFYNPAHYNFNNFHIMAKVPHNTGDGLVMAEAIGADTRPIHTLYIGPQNHPYSQRTAHLLKRPEVVKLTRDGERYQDENVQNNGKFGWMSGTAQNSIPERLCFSILDQSILDGLLTKRQPTSVIEIMMSLMEDEDEARSTVKDDDIGRIDDVNDEDTISLRAAAKKGSMAWMDGLKDALQSEVAKDRICIAKNMDEAAMWIGCNPETLKNTIREYNRFCRNGHDADFCKDPEFLQPLTTPPYYVIKATPGIDTVIGGLRVNHKLEVLNKEWKPINGLLAAGVVVGGWLPKDGYAFPGSEMGFTLYSGYTAGENAANFVR